jgi:glutamate-1-semialdehyde 2,1-aminomutase
VYRPCSQYEALFISAAHTEADIDATVAAAAETFATLERLSQTAAPGRR